MFGCVYYQNGILARKPVQNIPRKYVLNTELQWLEIRLKTQSTVK